ncbi:MAG: SgcJ/EcaC family oxidoreductase [Taibaiella sp.]|nr:SgcJ/EcaC family oxidoreductase [Taibaiella sp.]
MDTNQDTQTPILALYQQLLQQWNKRNAAGMTALFATNGSLIGFDGSQLNGQKEIYAVLDEIFANFPTAAYISIIKEVRLLSDTSALLFAVVGMVAQGQSDISPEVNAVQTMTAMMEDGKWRIALFQNTPAAFHGRPELSEQLSADLRHALQQSVTQN